MVADFNKKQKRASSEKLLLKCAAVGMALLVVFLVIADIRVYQKGKTLGLQIQNLQNKISNVRRSNEDLQEGIGKSGDRQYIEKIAREEFDLQQPGETVVSFTVAESPVAGNDAVVESVWQAWLGSTLEWIKNGF